MESAIEEDAESMIESKGDAVEGADYNTDGTWATADDGMDAVSDDGMEVVADSSIEAATDDGMETVTDDGIRERFHLFFSIHPTLKPGMWISQRL
jgi:hypothetical protein